MKNADGLKMMLRELDKWPGITYSLGHRTKHPVIHVHLGDQSFMHTYAGSPSDYRGARNKVSQLRRAIREMVAKTPTT